MGIESDEIQVRYDIGNLYPSWPPGKAIDATLNQIKNMKNFMKDIKTWKKTLTLNDVNQLIELCVSDWKISIWKLLILNLSVYQLWLLCLKDVDNILNINIYKQH